MTLLRGSLEEVYWMTSAVMGLAIVVPAVWSLQKWKEALGTQVCVAGTCGHMCCGHVCTEVCSRAGTCDHMIRYYMVRMQCVCSHML